MNRLKASLCNMLVIFAIVVTLGVFASAQTETILHSFTSGSDGQDPYAGLVFDSKGNLYGTTIVGGTTSLCSGCGVLFQLVPNSSGSWTENIIYSFDGDQGDGLQSYGNLVLDTNGNIFGTTAFGGSSFEGTVFELSPGSNGTWSEKVLYSFTGGADGSLPFAGVTLDASGNLYGTTNAGGQSGFGTIFTLTPGANGTWTEKVLHSFMGGNDGSTSFGKVILDSAGSICGTTNSAGQHDYGVVFKLTRGTAGGWTESVLYAFPGGSGGSAPMGNLVFDTTGNLYGVATYVVYELTPTSSGPWTEKILHNFAGGSDGAMPDGGLILDTSGRLYGTTNTGGLHRGTVFQLIPGSGGTWSEKVLHRFSPTGGDGTFPLYETLAIDASGNVYGTTSSGGTANFGTVFKIAP
jgi:uncharacterized repeat protein (TIGR03803 family)